ncbi:phage shock protein A [Ardenticatena maritima]|uniref:Phage shock protein A n=1 Tax=Ardenticatena maritima TaxID=872965 RepID=A0A0M8K865_9CHLR|nr:PspA/IM30 family protein [Ardenticatena maritima]KPL89344.1 phage-shock protein [Ardenticatena maritima]GAP63745.1 phage shock protein A [Ardenticatena maritima]
MGLLSQFMTIIRAKISQLLEGAEDPAATLDYSYQRQLQLLQNVKRGLVEVVTSRRRLELQAEKLREKITKLEDQARQALAAGREDLARLALQRKQTAAMQLADLEQQIQQLAAEQQRLQDAEARLEAKIEAFRTRKETIKAQYSAAEAQVKINEAVTGLGEEMADITMAIERIESKTEEMKARASAIDELVSIGALEDFTGEDAISRELRQLSAGQSVDEELEALRRQLEAPAEPPQLTDGEEA